MIDHRLTRDNAEYVTCKLRPILPTVHRRLVFRTQCSDLSVKVPAISYDNRK